MFFFLNGPGLEDVQLITHWLYPNQLYLIVRMGFPGGTSDKELTCLRRLDVRNACLIPGLKRSPGGGHRNPLQNSCLENPMERGAWWATVHVVAKSWIQLKLLSTQACTHKIYHLNHFPMYSSVVLSTSTLLYNRSP